MTTYADLARNLAADLAFLKVNDFINLRAGGNYVQVIQNPDTLTVEVMITRQIADRERQLLLIAGWQEPQRGQPTWQQHARWPITAANARALADRVADVAQTFLSPDITQLEYDARNCETGKTTNRRR